MNDPYDFIRWCKLNNSPIINITNANSYVELIKQKCKLPHWFTMAYTQQDNSTIMSINNIHL